MCLLIRWWDHDFVHTSLHHLHLLNQITHTVLFFACLFIFFKIAFCSTWVQLNGKPVNCAKQWAALLWHLCNPIDTSSRRRVNRIQNETKAVREKEHNISHRFSWSRLCWNIIFTNHLPNLSHCSTRIVQLWFFFSSFLGQWCHFF